MWLTKYTSRTFVEGRMAGERDGRAMKVGFVVVSLPSWINLDSVAPSEHKSWVSLFTGWVGDRVDMSLIDCA